MAELFKIPIDESKNNSNKVKLPTSVESLRGNNVFPPRNNREEIERLKGTCTRGVTTSGLKRKKKTKRKTQKKTQKKKNKIF